MKTKNQSVLHTLVVVLGLIPAGRVTAQTFTTLHNFTPLIPSFTNSDGTVRHTNSDGSHPHADLILSGNTLYGVAQVGGSSSSGTIFSLSLPLPQLTIIPSGANVVLTWPASATGFDYSGFILQSTTNLVSPVVWTTNSAAPFVVNGQNAVTNSISGAQKFYRLVQ